jgi:malate dehydrogenase
MNYLTEDKLVILGSAGAIGSNMVQAALTMGLTPNIAMYDPFEKGNEGAAAEMYHCAFPGARVTYSSNVKDALSGASYLISSGGAPRKEGMTREDLLKGNAEIAAQLGRDIKEYCPDLKFGVIIFNPADITGLVNFNIPQDDVTGCRTYGGHGEMMAPFASTTKVSGKPLADLIGTPELTNEAWDEIMAAVKQGGKRIIQLRGRSSFQSPAHQSLLMVKAVMDGKGYPWPSGVYVNLPDQSLTQIMMAMETTLGADGATYKMPGGTDDEIAALKASYEHLSKLRDEVIEMGLLPPLADWTKVNPNLG